MEKQGLGWIAVTLLVLASLIVGGIIAYGMFPRTEIKTETKYVDKLVEVPVTVEKIVEVEPDYAGDALVIILDKLQNNERYEDYLVCDGDQYDFEQLKVSKVYDAKTVSFSTKDTDDIDNALVQETNLKLRLKFTDADTEEKCYTTLKAVVSEVEGKSPKIKLQEI